MKHFKAVVCLVFLLLSGCERAATPFSQSSTKVPTERNPLPSRTVTPVANETPEEVGDPLLLDPTQVLTMEVEQRQDQLQSYALLPEFSGDLEANQNLTLYEIEIQVSLDPSHVRASLDGLARITYTHLDENPLDDLVLMLWPNDQQYNAEMVTGPVQIDGQWGASYVELGGLVLRIPLSEEITLGEKVQVDVPFTIETQGSIRDQRKRFGITNGVLVAPTFYPLIPRLVDGEWQAEIPPVGGDTTNSDVAFFDVTITAPEEFEIVTSGVEVDRQLEGKDQQRVRYVTGPMRDFALALGSLERIYRVVNGVQLNVWVLPDHIPSGERLANAATMQMQYLNEIVGPYPYAELDILDTPCAFGGIEYPGLIYICSLAEGYFIDTAVHEVAHQWFYGLIGNDQIREPWLDESAATYWQALYYENAVGEDRAAGQLVQYRSWVSNPEQRNAPIGLGIGDYPSSGDYYTIVYYKGAVFYDALRDQLGDERFFEFLRTYFERYRYQFVHSLDFQKTAEEVCDCDLSPFFDLWVYHGGEIPDW